MFINDLHNGIATTNDLDDYVEKWHKSDSEETLMDFLGFTEDEFLLYGKGKTDMAINKALARISEQ